MSKDCSCGLVSPSCGTNFREAVCIHTDKVYDSCRDKDCLEDIRVYLTAACQEIVDRAINVRCTKAEVIWVFSDIEPVPFNRGFYSVDLRYFFKITLSVYTGVGRPCTVEGLSTFEKKAVLFGSEGNAKIFESKYKEDAFDTQLWKKTNMPKTVVEVVDPIILGAKLVDVNSANTGNNCCCCCCDGNDFDISGVPDSISRVFDDSLVIDGETKRVFVSLGIFSIIKLERKTQLLIPCYDFCIPQKECVGSTEDSPCDLFERIDFPVDEFFPPEKCDFIESAEDDISTPPQGNNNSNNNNNNCECKLPTSPYRSLN